jgi:hypothetical protein
MLPMRLLKGLLAIVLLVAIAGGIIALIIHFWDAIVTGLLVLLCLGIFIGWVAAAQDERERGEPPRVGAWMWMEQQEAQREAQREALRDWMGKR